MVLPKTAESASAIAAAGLLEDKDLHTRLAAILAIADAPASPEVGRLLYKASANSDNYSDRWLSRAMFIAATRHKASFLTEYKADAKAVPSNSLPIAPGSAPRSSTGARPTKRRSRPTGRRCRSRGWESRGLEDFDGVVWFTRTIDVPNPRSDCNGFGRQGSNTAELWLNGQSLSLGPPPATPAGNGRGRGNARRSTRFRRHAEGRRQHDHGPDHQQPQRRRLSSARPTRCSCRRGDAGPAGGRLALSRRAADQRGSALQQARRTGGARGARQHAGLHDGNASSRRFGRPGRGDQAECHVRTDAVRQDGVERRAGATGGAGHHQSRHHAAQLRAGQQGSLQTIGTAADELARTPNGPAQQYVPQCSRCFSTKLIEPGETVTVQFKAPTEAGQYPHVCTFPGHWRIMNGVLNVKAAQGRGGRGGF